MSRLLEQGAGPQTEDVAPAAHRCRNCGALAAGRYCADCGQETRESLPTLREFMREAMGRLVAFDSRLWRTLFALVFRPGFLTRAYLSGARRRYVSPARLFLAMSLLLFAVIRFEVGTPDLSKAIVENSPAEREAARAERAAIAAEGGGEGFQIGLDDDLNVVIRGAAQSWVADELRHRFDRFNRQPPAQKAQQILDGALRYGSYVAFVLLPLFAALQFLSYAGSRRGRADRPRLYAEHLVYASHLHAFGFMMAAVLLAVPVAPIRWLLLAWMPYYILRAKQVVYGGRWPGRVARSLLVLVVYLLAVVAATIGLVFVAILWR